MQSFPEVEAANCINRKAFINPALETKRNSCVVISIETVTLHFPYKYNFAYTFNERFITVVKWLKKLHKKEEDEEENKPLPSDLFIKIQNFSMEIADDPFEIKLRDNYELLEDEYHESLKRLQMLNDKIQEKKTSLSLAPSKLEELYAALYKKNADIYIQRSKQLNKTANMARSCVFTVRLEGVSVQVAADMSYHTYDNAVEVLRSVDSESPLPDDLRFQTIWCRRVIGEIQNGVIRLRDFPHPMMEGKALHFRGYFLGAEQEPHSRAYRDCTVDIGQNFESIVIQRSMTTLKFYHDILLEVDYLSYTHGSCWEPVLQQLTLAFESIKKPSLDPSPSLPWWDRMRFLFHGPLVIAGQQMSIFFHASLDPYNSTELIEILLSKSVLDWLTGKILMRGNMDVLVHTASKYDECRIIHLPSVKVSLGLNWVCQGNKNDHHSVMPCAPDKVPEYSSNQVHDSFRAFRSHNLNVAASFETKQSTLDKTNNNVPSVSIYNSTLRWLENKKFMVSGLSRLTRRGKLFGNVKPRKTPFGRSFKNIRVTVCLHQLKVTYWSSFSKQRGCEIISGHLSHSAEHTMTLVPIEDGLIHR